MKYRSLSFIAASLLLFPAAGSLAADDGQVTGSVELGIRAVDETDSGAKFLEYRDLDDGIFGSIFLNYFMGSYYLSAEGLNVGLDDQSYRLEGGDFGRFKYSFFYDEIPHNLSFDAITPYSGIGTDTLSINLADPMSMAGWQTFDYAVDRKEYGGAIKGSFGSPFFVRIAADRLEEDGVKPLGTGEFSGQVELPEPVDYTDDTFSIAGGFMADQLTFKVSGTVSDFDNDNMFVRWQNPFSGAFEVNTLPPDNDYGKVAANLSWRGLPMISTLLLSGSYANLSSDISANEIGIAAPEGLGLNRIDFDGDISYTDFSATFVSNPLAALSTRLYYSFLDRDNDSSIIEARHPPHEQSDPPDSSNERFLLEYTKHNLGLDATYDIGMDTVAGFGYEFLDADRDNRPDAESNTDNIFFAKVRNSSLDMMSASLRYTFMDRKADTDFHLAGVTPADPEFIEQFVSRFDYTDKQMHKVEASVEIVPAETVDIGLDYTFLYNDYDDVVLGRTEDERHKFYVDLGVRPTPMLLVSGFGGYELYEADSNHYNFRAGFQGQTANPLVDDGDPGSFRWTQALNEDFWTVGVLAQVMLMNDRLKLSMSWEYQKSDGESDFGSQGTPLQDIEESIDYDITTFELKGVYALTSSFDVTLGYLYEESEYDDLQFIGYEYLPPGSLLSGAYADHDYEAHVGYLTVRYNF